MDFDLPWPGRLAPLHADFDDAVTVGGFDLFRIDILRERDDTAEVSLESLIAVAGRIGFLRRFAAPTHGQHVLLQRDLERLGIDAWGEKIDGVALQINLDKMPWLTRETFTAQAASFSRC